MSAPVDPAPTNLVVNGLGNKVKIARAEIYRAILTASCRVREIIVVATKRRKVQSPHDGFPLGAMWPDPRAIERPIDQMSNLVRNGLLNETIGVFNE